MTAERFSPGFATLLLLAVPSGGSAQSFDCDKATTTSERVICADQTLGVLDSELAAEVKKALAADPAQRDELLAEERQWATERDKTCSQPAGPMTGEARARAVACLTAAYNERIAAVRPAPTPAPPLSAEAQAARARTEICQRIGDRYRLLLGGAPQAPFKKSFYADSPLETLAAFGAGVTIADPSARFDDYSRRKVVDWAKSQPQPFLPSESVLKAIEDIVSSRLRIDRLPNANIYAASVAEGTAGCRSSIYFEVENKRAMLAEGPAAWETAQGEGCGVTRAFGTIDATPVAFEDANDHTPSLQSSLSVTSWNGKGFDPACTLSFQFAPRFDAHGSFNAWDESCDGADCDALRQAALALVEEAQKNPLDAQKAAVARLTAQQRRQFAQLKKIAGPAEPPADEASNLSDPASYTDAAPLLLPLVHESRVYLAALGHFTIGWRIFSDWSVTLKRLDNGKARDRATFAIGMTKGRLESFAVK